jgi:ketosteroid isomerase-like protein
MDTDGTIRELAARFFDAAERGDLDAISECFAGEIVVWHNIDEREKNKAECLASLAGSFSRLSDREYADRRMHIFSGGFVQQHVLRGTRKDGLRISMPAAVVCCIRDGKIFRLDEYLDTPRVAEARKVFS